MKTYHFKGHHIIERITNQYSQEFDITIRAASRAKAEELAEQQLCQMEHRAEYGEQQCVHIEGKCHLDAVPPK